MAGEFDELMQLAADLEAGPASLSGYVRKAVQVTSNNVKKDAQATASKRHQIGHAASAIHYETSESSSGVESEIGYDKNHGAGDLGNLLEFGSPRIAPSHDLGNALLNNESDFVDGLGKAVADSLRDVNL